ncbi:hypothetical protein MGA5115_03293 [Marinomonas gallaica]|uniref:Uncharacterized protein n=2 Tax=Marinomonas gallaica TaxID=1806667 RepID=A0A1C3JVK8_9GAMM|nr:hypothetical protein MGA5115_03293 [Marinomonas gallaica]SBT22724.1 hypothetical protein MGA5116_03349 [Marinomonas gallaica]
MLNLNFCKLLRPKLVAFAQDSYLDTTAEFIDSEALPSCVAPIFGPDLNYGLRRKIPYGSGVGATEAELKSKILQLVNIFASDANTDLTSDLFNSFLKKNNEVKVFSDQRLNTLASNHQNIKSFCNRALSAPEHPPITAGQKRIHQALKNANWSIENINVPINLGVPAFNNGTPFLRSGDYGNGLGLMINGIQYVYVFSTSYNYFPDIEKYIINLDYYFYDVFGLDDDDLLEFGAKGDGLFSRADSVGITAWWQLQHQFGYAPLVTRCKVSRSYEVTAI